MAHSLFAFYNQPEDPAAFDRHYDDVHSRLGLALAGLRSFAGVHTSASGDELSPYHFVAVLEFDSKDALDSALASPEGQAAVADLENFATAGVTFVNGPITNYR